MTTQSSNTTPLEYADPSVNRPTFDLYRGATACGALPLISGVAIFSLWFITRWPLLELAGMLTIMLGLAAFVAGCTMLLLYVRARLRAGVESPRRVLGRTALAGLLLLANFPAALACFEAAWFLQTQYTLVVTNAGTVTVNSFIVTGPGINHEFGPLPPRTSAKRRFHIATDGTLTFSMTVGQTASTGDLAGYITNGMGAETIVTINGSNVMVREPWNSK